MSILIKGMKMPAKGEYELLLFCHSDGTATLEGHFTKFEGEPFEVIEVPTPHGRLIDEDELTKSIHDDWDDVIVWDESGVTTADEFERLVYEQPTIIEAEEGAEE